MPKLLSTVRKHLHFIVVVTLLTVFMTFPTIVYVSRTDVFWLPTGRSEDAFIKLWDTWYAMKVLNGQADRWFTDLIFYPEGVSLANHPFFWPQVIVVNGLQIFMPLSNAFNLSVLLIVFTSALAAYVYLLWLFNDKWLALFGAAVFGFCPYVHANISINAWLGLAWLAVFPLVLYSFHRGVAERRTRLVVLAGALAGLTAVVSLYNYVQLVIMLGIFAGVFAISRWKDADFWRNITLLVVALAITSAWRILPMVQQRQALTEALDYYGGGESHNDLLAHVTSYRHPVLGPLARALLQPPPKSAPNTSFSYLGFLPIALVCVGLYNRETRSMMLPWLGLLSVFLILRLGSTLQINGTMVFEGILLLPKYYLDLWFPAIFRPFDLTQFFIAGAQFPWAVLTCFGLRALRKSFPAFGQPRYILALILIVSFEYFVPVQMEYADPISGNPFSEERLAYLDWLKQENDDSIALINLPLDRANSKLYLFYQSLSGYPQTEGAISRTPDSAHDYIRANQVLRFWYENRPTNCVLEDRNDYFAGVTQLQEDGFTHVVHHYGLYYWERVIDSFRYVDPAYSDEFVAIYRLSDLLSSCPQ